MTADCSDAAVVDGGGGEAWRDEAKKRVEEKMMVRGSTNFFMASPGQNGEGVAGRV